MIRLLNASSHQLPTTNNEMKDQQSQPYIIISHVWLDNEIVYEDLISRVTPLSNTASTHRPSAAKILGACNTVLRHSNNAVKYLWLDSVCIDKKNNTELSTSINSMYRWYQRARTCFVYLADYPSAGVRLFTQSKWFTRGWTLQELVAPAHVVFFDKDWHVIGDKMSLQPQLTTRTKISGPFLLGQSNISAASIAQRMSWSSGRRTTVPEDTAYCLMGMFGVNMPLLYGEGRERAFRRLQEEIMRYSDDPTIFAWTSSAPLTQGSGLLSISPDYFEATGVYEHKTGWGFGEPFELTNKGISINVCLQLQGELHVASIECPVGESHHLGIWLERLPGTTQQYRRVRTSEMCRVKNAGRGRPTRIFVKRPDDI